MRRKNAAVLMTAVIIGGLLTSCGSAYNNTNGKNSDNTVETQTTARTVVNGETKTDGNNAKTDDKETKNFTQEVSSEENNRTDNEIAGNTEASEEQAFDDLSQADGYENNSGQESGKDSGSGDDYKNSDGESYGDGDSPDNSEETDIPSASEDVNSDYNLLARAQINTVTYSTYANEVLRLVNIERTNVGVFYFVNLKSYAFSSKFAVIAKILATYVPMIIEKIIFVTGILLIVITEIVNNIAPNIPSIDVVRTFITPCL